MIGVLNPQEAAVHAAALAEKIKAIDNGLVTVPAFIESMGGVFVGSLKMAVEKVERGRPAQ